LDEARARRATVLILLILTIIVFLRAIASAQGATRGVSTQLSAAARGTEALISHSIALRIDEPENLLEAGARAHRTLVLGGLRPSAGDLELEWTTLSEGESSMRGRHSITSPRGDDSRDDSRIVLSLPLPDVERPAGLELSVVVRDGGRPVGGGHFPFTLYPGPRFRKLHRLFASARVGLYDPRGTAAPILRSVGLNPEIFDAYEDLMLYDGALIVVGSGGFVRDHEALGPVLGAQARAGKRVLILDQPNFPGTLSEDLRLWPAFNRPRETEVLLDSGHPILNGVRGEQSRAYFTSGTARSRPLLPPTRGNFRVLAELRVRAGPAWRQGVTLLELPIGDGSVVASQAAIPSLYHSDARARILLINTLAYLLEEQPRPARAHLYGEDAGDLPDCLAQLDPRLLKAPLDLGGTDVLLAPADWRAPRRRDEEGLPLLSQVARFLHEGGTLVLVNPQSLVKEYMRRLTGEAIHFRIADPDTSVIEKGSSMVLRGVAPTDLALLARQRRTELRLLGRSGPEGIRPILLVPGLAEYRVGRGTLVALSLPDADDCRRSRTSTLLARILTNLGVPLHRSPGVDLHAVSLLNE
jgi:hypothetical protein